MLWNWVKSWSIDASTSADQVYVGAEAANMVTKKFVNPIKLEFEKVYFPYLLISKKRYAGLYWTKPDKYDKMDSKGIEVYSTDVSDRIVTH